MKTYIINWLQLREFTLDVLNDKCVSGHNGRYTIDYMVGEKSLHIFDLDKYIYLDYPETEEEFDVVIKTLKID